MYRLFIEGFYVGIIILFFGSLISFFFKIFYKKKLPKQCRNWNKYYIMEITLFLTGFLSHVFSEYVGLNKTYCDIGYACNK